MIITAYILYLSRIIILWIVFFINDGRTEDNTSVSDLFNDQHVYVIHWSNDPVLKSSLSVALFPPEPSKAGSHETIPLQGESLNHEQLQSAVSQVRPTFSKVSTKSQTSSLDNNEDLPKLFMITDALKSQFICTIPYSTISSNQTRDNESTKRTTKLSPRQLMEGLRSMCLYHVSGWWTYELCHEKHVRQFHSLSIEEKPTDSYHLGYFNLIATESQKSPSHHGKLSYYVQRYTDGSICDVTGKPREAEVRYFCDDNEEIDHIETVKEIGYCRYEFHVRTPRLCSLPEYYNFEKQSHILNIQCHPIIDNITQETKISGLYTDFLLPSKIRIGSHLMDDAILEMHLDPSRRAKLSTSESNLPIVMIEKEIEFTTDSTGSSESRLNIQRESERILERNNFESADEIIDVLARKILNMAFDDPLNMDRKTEESISRKDSNLEDGEQKNNEKKLKQTENIMKARERLRTLRTVREKLRQSSLQQSPTTARRLFRPRSPSSLLTIYNMLLQDDIDEFEEPLIAKDSFKAHHNKESDDNKERDDNKESDDNREEIIDITDQEKYAKRKKQKGIWY